MILGFLPSKSSYYPIKTRMSDNFRQRIRQELISLGIADDVLSEIRSRILQTLRFSTVGTSSVSISNEDFAIVSLIYHYLYQLGIFERSLSVFVPEFKSITAKQTNSTAAIIHDILPVSSCREILKIPCTVLSSKESLLLYDLIRVAAKGFQSDGISSDTQSISIQTEEDAFSLDGAVTIEDQTYATIHSHIRRLQEQYKNHIEHEVVEQSNNIEKIIQEYQKRLEAQLNTQYEAQYIKFRENELDVVREEESKRYHTKLADEIIRLKENYDCKVRDLECKYDRHQDEIKQNRHQFEIYKLNSERDLEYRTKQIHLEEQRIKLMMANAEMKVNEAQVKHCMIENATVWETEQTKKSLQDALETLNNQRKILDEDNAKLNTERDEIRKQKLYNDDLRQLKDEIAILRRDNEKFKVEIKEYQYECDVLRQKNNEAKMTQESIESRLKHEQERRVITEKQLELKLTEISVLNNEKQMVATDNDKLKRLLTKSQTALEALKYSGVNHFEVYQAKKQRYTNKSDLDAYLLNEKRPNGKSESGCWQFTQASQFVKRTIADTYHHEVEQDNVSSLTCDLSKLTKSQILESLGDISNKWNDVDDNHQETSEKDANSNNSCIEEIMDSSLKKEDDRNYKAILNGKRNEIDDKVDKDSDDVCNKIESQCLSEDDRISIIRNETCSDKSRNNDDNSITSHLDYTHDFEVVSLAISLSDETPNGVVKNEESCYDDDFDDTVNDCIEQEQILSVNDKSQRNSTGKSLHSNSSSVFNLSKSTNEVASYDTNYQQRNHKI